MRPPFWLVSLFVVAGCSRGPTFEEVRRDHQTELDRVVKAVRAAAAAVKAAPPASPGAECSKSGLTAARIDTRYNLTEGNAEVLSAYMLQRTLNPFGPETPARDKVEDRTGGPVTSVAYLMKPGHPYAEQPGNTSTPASEKDVATLLAAAKVDNLIVLRGEGKTIEAFLFDVPGEKIVCGFAVVGTPDADAENRDTIVTDRSTGKSYQSSTGEVEASAIANAPKQMAAELRARFGFSQHPDPTASPAPNTAVAAEVPAEVATATARLATMHAKLQDDAPACTEFPKDSAMITIQALRKAAGGTLDAKDPLSSFSKSEAKSVTGFLFEQGEGGKELAEEFLRLPSVHVFVPERFTPPQPNGGAWTTGTLDLRFAVFEGETLKCATRWQLETPEDLRAELSGGQVTERSAREAALKHLTHEFAIARLPTPG